MRGSEGQLEELRSDEGVRGARGELVCSRQSGRQCGLRSLQPQACRESWGPAEPAQRATCLLPAAVCLPWEAFLALSSSCVCPVFILCASHIPCLSAQGHRGMGVGWGGGQGHRKCLVGACGPGQSWQPPQEERTFRGRLRSLHSPRTPPHPPLARASKERALGG